MEIVRQAAVNTNHFADVTVELGPIKVVLMRFQGGINPAFDHQLRLVNIPSFTRFLCIPGGCVGISEPSTVP